MLLAAPPPLDDTTRMGPSLVHRIRVEAHAIWLAVRDPRTPLLARAFGVLVAAYALSPIDLVPDFIPVLGLLDDMLLIPLGVWLFEKMVPRDLFAEHRAAAEAASQRPVSWAGIAIVVAIWLLIALLIWDVATWYYD
jgi:uncharacterized membrane protein YkvA (DUF1232 family)